MDRLATLRMMQAQSDAVRRLRPAVERAIQIRTDALLRRVPMDDLPHIELSAREMCDYFTAFGPEAPSDPKLVGLRVVWQ